MASYGVPVVLGYHSLPTEASADPYDIPFSTFLAQIDDIRGLGARFPKNPDLYPVGGSETTDDLEVIVTFDDGHATDLYATEILCAKGIRPILFITTGFLGRSSKWLTPKAVRKAHDLGAVIASHGESHSFLNRLSSMECRHELAHSKRELEDIVGTRVDMLSFPGGRYNRKVIDTAREEGYEKLFTSKPSLDFEMGADGCTLIHRLMVTRNLSSAVLHAMLLRDKGVMRKMVAIYKMKRIAKWMVRDENYQRLWEMIHKR